MAASEHREQRHVLLRQLLDNHTVTSDGPAQGWRATRRFHDHLAEGVCQVLGKRRCRLRQEWNGADKDLEELVIRPLLFGLCTVSYAL